MNRITAAACALALGAALTLMPATSQAAPDAGATATPVDQPGCVVLQTYPYQYYCPNSFTNPYSPYTGYNYNGYNSLFSGSYGQYNWLAPGPLYPTTNTYTNPYANYTGYSTAPCCASSLYSTGYYPGMSYANNYYANNAYPGNYYMGQYYPVGYYPSYGYNGYTFFYP